MRTKRSRGKKGGENSEEKRKNADDQDAMPKRDDKEDSNSEEETQSDMYSDESEDDQGAISQSRRHRNKKGKPKEIRKTPSSVGCSRK
ncbi:hypothetical protein Pmani_006008 [Petrolisthes manimaculis]|uniref:Uncharacterized protein n=1 Tax=Petrolisthes manimaculis TaxID=1843537 RepID=A0AAE1QB40_9EUCA|nr:hypothetical protein Pmani_006008 [Petrolisthes manimaculis]